MNTTARELYSELRYQLQPVTGATWGPCAAESCEKGARGGRTCAECLTDEFRVHIGYLADELFEALLASKLAILAAEERLDKIDRRGKDEPKSTRTR